MLLSINHRKQKSNLLMYSLVKGLLQKVYDSTTLKMFLRLLKKGRVYSFHPVAFFVNIITPPLSADDQTSIILQQEMSLNCLGCLSSRAYWNEAPLKSLVSELQALYSQTKQADDFLSFFILKSKDLLTILEKSYWSI